MINQLVFEVLDRLGIDDPLAYLQDSDREIEEHDLAELQTTGSVLLAAGDISTDEELKKQEASLELL